MAPCSSRVQTRLLAALVASCCVVLAAEASYYDILGVQKTADQVQHEAQPACDPASHRSHTVEQAAIKRAYRKQAIKWHPDKVPGLSPWTLLALCVCLSLHSVSVSPWAVSSLCLSLGTLCLPGHSSHSVSVF